MEGSGPRPLQTDENTETKIGPQLVSSDHFSSRSVLYANDAYQSDKNWRILQNIGSCRFWQCINITGKFSRSTKQLKNIAGF